MCGAAATMVGQNLGARKPERAARAVYLTGFYNMAFLALVAAAFIFAPEIFAGLFTSDSSELRYAVDCLRLIAYGNQAAQDWPGGEPDKGDEIERVGE